MSASDRSQPPGLVQEPAPFALDEVVRFLSTAVAAERGAKVIVEKALAQARDAGLSMNEIATVMGISKSAVAQRLAVLERRNAHA